MLGGRSKLGGIMAKPNKLPIFASMLRSARAQLGLGQMEISIKLKALGYNVSQSLITQLETGKIGNPSAKNLKMIASVYGINFEKLVQALIKDKYGLELCLGNTNPICIDSNEGKKVVITITLE